MALPDFSMRQLLEAGVHFGHQKHRWNPKMEQYIFGVRNDIHILDLAQTVPALYKALQMVSDTVAEGGRVLFVGTKRQAAPVVAEAARQSAQYYVNSRWLGGMLTNWQTISKSIARLRELEDQESEGMQGLTKKERLQRSRERDRLERDLGGIKDMGNVPNLLFVIDTNKESLALNEARRLGIPVIAIADTNCDPEAVDLPIPGNDDAARAIELYCSLISKAALDGISRSSVSFGEDLGEAVEVSEPVLEETAPAAAAEAPAEAPAAEAPKAEEAAEADATPLFDKPAGDADDLKKISGVGPVLEQKLNDLGIYTFAQIAAFSAEDIANVDDRLNFKGRIERDGWIDQAKELGAQ
ncbi:30S ribosomal protein S2 [Maritalea myrionectae]|uniref:30S ribosomal protein S2 n=1 Tax=Maritalea myrionectae TaxID=454601 RepID=UPI0003FE86C7|nr:30S ribosomal protein S2 [Maritalea myrionectae]